MNFSYLEEVRQKFDEILVIGRDFEREGKKYHFIGITVAMEAKLYLIEPFMEEEEDCNLRKGVQSQRKRLKQHKDVVSRFLHSRYITIGKQQITVLGGSCEALNYVVQEYGIIQVFMDMMNAGWTIPEWLKEEEWDNLQLVTLELADLTHIPDYKDNMPIIIKHDEELVGHFVEKTVTLDVGKSRTINFVDHNGEKVECYINNVTLIDVWEEMLKQFSDERHTKNMSAAVLEQIKESCIQSLRQCCPKGMCYIGVEYECSKDMRLQFYSKEYLRSVPTANNGSSSFMAMRLKPDEELGTHQLPLKGCVIQMAVPSDTTKIAAELFCYYEKEYGWEESI